ncbi:MAG: indole-3-glycerol phosphate synthase TrpC [Anaerolineae bacterium]|nr:indole-3-glycerol phosphate synthase TrpC [Anaerolineae bacterium]
MSILDTILEHKRNVEVPQRKLLVPMDVVRREAESAPPPRDFADALRKADGTVALIAEVKRASPSKGIFIKGEFKPVEIAQTYEANGASAISVLTDENYFQGHLNFMTAVRRAVKIPVLRKDFIVDAYQLYEARAAEADAALLIVAALDDAELRDLHQLALELELTPLVEVHDEAETERAMAIGAGIHDAVIGVNNRDLRTFNLDIETTARCASKLAIGYWQYGKSPIAPMGQPIGHSQCLVSESGIFTPADVARVAAMGARAVLVGESIIVSLNMAEQVRALASVTIGH